jgi:hypothetical protein
VASFADGSFLVTWVDIGNKNKPAIFGQRFNAQSQPADAIFQVNSMENHSRSQPAVAAFGRDMFIVTWTLHGGGMSGDDIYGRRFEAQTSPTSCPAQRNVATGCFTQPAASH